MRVPRVLERENAGHRSLSLQAPGNGVCLGFEMLRLTARCCGEMRILRARHPQPARLLPDSLRQVRLVVP